MGRRAARHATNAGEVVHFRFGRDLAIRLRDARRAANLNQEELGRLVGYNAKTISSYETRRVDSLKVVDLLRILRVCNVSPAEFFGDDDFRPTRDIPAGTAVHELARLLEDVQEFPPKLAVDLCRMIRTVIATVRQNKQEAHS